MLVGSGCRSRRVHSLVIGPHITSRSEVFCTRRRLASGLRTRQSKRRVSIPQQQKETRQEAVDGGHVNFYCRMSLLATQNIARPQNHDDHLPCAAHYLESPAPLTTCACAKGNSILANACMESAMMPIIWS